MISADLAAEMAEAVGDALGQGVEWKIVRQAISGSRINYLLEVKSARQVDYVWCRATERVIDEAFGARYRLAAEASVLQALEREGIAVPSVLGRSSAGHAFIQRFVDSIDEPGQESAEAVSLYMQALDVVHDLDPASILGHAQVAGFDLAAGAVAHEQRGWSAIADDLLERDALPGLGAQEAGLSGLHGRVDAIRHALASVAAPQWSERPTLVHGDAGRANFIRDGSGAIWLLDWELAHVGSRLEDYAWCEVRGLEQNSGVWLGEVLARLEGFGHQGPRLYNHFRSLIFFRSVIAMASRITADPSSGFIPYLTRRLCENEWLGWLSIRECGPGEQGLPPVAPEGLPAGAYGLAGGSNLRLTQWNRWTNAINSLVDKEVSHDQWIV